MNYDLTQAFNAIVSRVQLETVNMEALSDRLEDQIDIGNGRFDKRTEMRKRVDSPEMVMLIMYTMVNMYNDLSVGYVISPAKTNDRFNLDLYYGRTQRRKLSSKKKLGPNVSQDDIVKEMYKLFREATQ